MRAPANYEKLYVILFLDKRRRSVEEEIERLNKRIFDKNSELRDMEWERKSEKANYKQYCEIKDLDKRICTAREQLKKLEIVLESKQIALNEIKFERNLFPAVVSAQLF